MAVLSMGLPGFFTQPVRSCEEKEEEETASLCCVNKMMSFMRTCKR